MSKDPKKINEEVLFSYITENLDQEMVKAVEDWMKVSEENKSYVAQLRKLLSKAQSFSLFDESDLK